MIYTTNTHREITAIDSLEETARNEEHSESPGGGKQRSSEWERLLHKLTKPRQLFLGQPGSVTSTTLLPCTAFLELNSSREKARLVGQED